MANPRRITAILEEHWNAIIERERRRSPREEHITVGLVLPDQETPSQQPLWVQVSDVSVHGVGFRSSVAFKVDQRFRIQLGAGPMQLASRLRIVRCHDRNDGTFEVGGEFV